MHVDRQPSEHRCILGDEIGNISRWEIDDVEAGREVGRMEELVLSAGSFGGDVEEADVDAVVDDKALSELEERDDVAHAGT